MIDFILEKTSAASLTYIGHSQGTTQAFAAFSSNPVVASKVNLFIGKIFPSYEAFNLEALAPVGLFTHQNSTTLSFLNKFPDWSIFDILGDGGFPADNTFIHFLEEFFPTICDDFPPNCENTLFTIGGCNDISEKLFVPFSSQEKEIAILRTWIRAE